CNREEVVHPGLGTEASVLRIEPAEEAQSQLTRARHRHFPAQFFPNWSCEPKSRGCHPRAGICSGVLARHNGRLIRNIMTRRICMNCGGKDLREFLDLGDQPNGNSFLYEHELSNERFFPLAMMVCPS